MFQNSFKRSNFMQNQISLNLKISLSPPQSLFLFFCTEMYIPRFDIPCVKGSLCPASFVFANQIFPATIVTFSLKEPEFPMKGFDYYL